MKPAATLHRPRLDWRKKPVYSLLVLLSTFAVLEGLAWLVVPSHDPFLLANRPHEKGLANLDTYSHALAIGDGFVLDEELCFRLDPDFRIPGTFEVATSGFRENDPFPEKKEDGERWIVCLGDSCTFGLGVEDVPNTYPRKLESYLRDLCPGTVRVFNRGVPGYSSYQMLRFFEIYLTHRPIDVVTVYAGLNDEQERHGGVMDKDWLKSAGLARQGIRKGWKRQSRALWRLRSALRVSRAFHLMESALFQVRYGDARFSPRVTKEDYGRNLTRLAYLARQNGARLVLIMPPVRHDWQPDVHRQYMSVLRSVATEEGIPLVDAEPLFKSSGEDLFTDSVHPDDAGHRLIARALADTVADLLGRTTDTGPGLRHDGAPDSRGFAVRNGD